ncbi:hypothetical protein [Rothia kristinae]|nr:hypothetical protein [Rothia kristinae]
MHTLLAASSQPPLDPFHDPTPLLHWLQEVGPSILEVVKAMLGFAGGFF